ncbi:MAG: glycosyltransferase family 4 protein [Acidobacteria bacterium]|nr:glycosyltransferase family 4 protein [Acidobacteriota bacterium]
MRVLLIIDWNRGRGGAEAYAAWLRDGLRAAGDEVLLLTSSAGTAGDGAAEYVAYGTEQVVAQTLLQIVNPFAAQTVRRAVREFRPDVVWVNMFAHHLSPAVLLAMGDVPTVLFVSDYKVICPLGSKLLPDGRLCESTAGRVCYQSGCLSFPHWVRDQARYALIRSALRRVDRVIACSEWVRRSLQQEGVRSEVEAVPAPAAAPGFIRKPAQEPTFLYFGRLAPEKGVSLLIRAFRRLSQQFPSARLMVVGEGAERASLEALAATSGLSGAVEFLGWLSPEQLDEPLSRAWAAVVPSLWAEPHGLVAVEAIVRGTPVICSASGGLGEIVEDGVSGLKFPNNDEEALLHCLRQVASGEAFPERAVSAEVVSKVQARYDMAVHIGRIQRILRESAQATKGGAIATSSRS